MNIIDELENIVNVETRKTALNLLVDLVRQTPVDTGRARGNWQMNIKTPKLDIIENTSSSESISVALGVASKTKSVKYPVIYITNNLPYIVPLNNGHSTQNKVIKWVEGAMKRATNV